MPKIIYFNNCNYNYEIFERDKKQRNEDFWKITGHLQVWIMLRNLFGNSFYVKIVRIFIKTLIQLIQRV